MNCTISISILNLESPSSTLLTLMFFHNHLRFLGSSSLQGSTRNALRILFSIWYISSTGQSHCKILIEYLQRLKLNLKNNGHLDSEHVQDQQTLIDLDCFSTVEELVELGPEKLKEALASMGLKVGSTIQQRAERLLLTKDTPLEKLDKKHFAKGSRGFSTEWGCCSFTASWHIAFLEAKLKKLSDLLSEVGICCLAIYSHLLFYL